MSDWDTSLAALNSAIQFAGAQVGAVEDKKWIAKENQKARDFSLEMWNKANEYNLPINQMARLQEAGLNPNLVYGNGANTLTDYIGSPGHSAPNPGTGQLANARGIAMQQFALQKELQKSQLEVNDSIINRNVAEESKLYSDANKADAETKGLGYENDIKPEMLKKQLESLGLDVDLKNLEQVLKETTLPQDIAIKMTQLEKLAAERDLTGYQAEVNRNEALKLIEEINNAIATRENIKKEGKLIDAKVATEGAQQAALKASAYESTERGKTEASVRAKNSAEASSASAMARYYSALKSKIPAEIAGIRASSREAISHALNYNADTKLKSWEVTKIANDIEEQLYNGNVDRAIKIIQKYGTSLPGIIHADLDNIINGTDAKALQGVQRKVIKHK